MPGWRERWHERLRTADFAAYLAASEDRPALEAILPAMAMPCCVYVGAADPILLQAREASRLIPHARFFSMPGLDHNYAFYRAELVLPRVTAFLRGES